MVVVMLTPSLLWADEGESKADYEHARQLVSEGVILPLSHIINQANLSNNPSILEVELKKKHGRWIYELELLQEDGEVIELKYDAQNGQSLGREHD